MKRILALLLAIAPALGLAEATAWNLDPAHAHTSFAIRHLVISTVRGDFAKLSGAAQFDDKDVTKSSVETTIDVAS
ncbi:MAG TPA: YceI family protein, partial [Anaeromyxobacter sp.]